MHSLVNELAKKLNLPPNEAEEAISAVLIRIRAGLETIGEVVVEGLGTFRLIDGLVTFEPVTGFADEINKEFAGMKPVALTSTGESVDPNDRRALPGADPPQGDGNLTEAEEVRVSEPEPEDEPSMPQTSPVGWSESGDGDSDSEDTFSFTSPPPPRPSKIRVPPSERRSARPRRRLEASDEFPDMGPVVTTRPVEPIGAGIPARRQSKTPLAVAAGIVAVGLVSWLILGGTDDEPASITATAEVAPPVAPSEQLPVEPAMESEAADPREAIAALAEPEIEAENVEAMPELASERTIAPDPTPAQPAVEQEPEVPELAEVEAAPLSHGSGPIYAWIVASYPSRSEAENRADRMRQSGFDASVFEATVRGEPTFRVGIGHFESEALARRNQGMVPPEAADAWITRVK